VPTTAQTLIAYRAELLAGGVPPETVDHLTRDAAQQLIAMTGLVIDPNRSNTPQSTTPAKTTPRG